MAQGTLSVREFRLIPFHAPGAFPALGNIGGLYHIPVNLCVGNFTMVRGTAGSSGTTTCTISRSRAGVTTPLATLNIAFNTGAFAVATISLGTLSTLGPAPIGILDAGDIVFATLTAVEGGSPRDLSVCIECR